MNLVPSNNDTWFIAVYKQQRDILPCSPEQPIKWPFDIDLGIALINTCQSSRDRL